ncbi:MAG TPA: response regulator [Gemmatimonadales bacterium]
MSSTAARSTPDRPDATIAALDRLRDGYRQAVPATLATLRRQAAQLDDAPDAEPVLLALRRELHRVHGSGGSYGFAAASGVAAALETRVAQWIADSSLDCERRADIVRSAIHLLASAFGVEEGAAASPAGARSAPLPAAPQPGEVAPDVVIVDDDLALSAMLEYAIRSSGLTLAAFGSGPEALHALLATRPSASGARPLVLLDVDLPGLDGHSLHERLAAERPDAFRVVFMSAHTGEAGQLRALRAGALDYVVKPLSLPVLLAKLPLWLASARAPRPAMASAGVG